MRRGEKGHPGTTGVSGLETVGASSGFDSTTPKTVVVRCPAGKRVVGGGAAAWGRAMISITEGIALSASHPLEDGAWIAAAHEIDATEEDWFLRANAVCAAGA